MRPIGLLLAGDGRVRLQRRLDALAFAGGRTRSWREYAAWGEELFRAAQVAQSIYAEGIKNVTAGANPMDLKRGIDQAVEGVCKQLKKLSKPIKDKKEISQVGSISANNDSTIGDIIAEAMEKAGHDRRPITEGGGFPGIGELAPCFFFRRAVRGAHAGPFSPSS